MAASFHVLCVLLACLSTACSPRIDSDVIVVGAGPAGLAAAREARQAGASVLVLEGHEEPGGRTRWGSGIMLLAGTSTQARLGIDDSPTRLETDWPRITGAAADPWARAFLAAQATEVHDWLLGLGLHFHEAMPEEATRVGRNHRAAAGSPEIVRVLGQDLDVDLRTGAWVTGLVG